MPVDEDGNRADIITGPDSVPGRMNLARVHVPYFGAAARDVRKMMLEAIGYPRNWRGEMSIEEIKAIPVGNLNKAVEIMLKYYSIVSPRSFKEYTEYLTEEERYEWMRYIFNKELYTYIPVDKHATAVEMITQIEQNFKLTYGPVTYRGHSGVLKKTKNKVRIAPTPIMLLDKIADDWLAVDIGKLNNFGILAAMNRADKHSRPWKQTPPRTCGETEMRLYRVYGGVLFASELMDRNGAIATQREIAKNLLRADQPSNVYTLVDRKKIPFGSTRPLQIANQFFYCLGVKITYKKEKR